MATYQNALISAHTDERVRNAQTSLLDVADALTFLCWDLSENANDVLPDEDADAIRDLRDMIEATRDDVIDAWSALRLALDAR